MVLSDRVIRTCKHCREANYRKHVTNNCPAFDDLRERACEELDELRKKKVKMKDNFKGVLEKAFLDGYFKPGPKNVKELEVLKKFCLQLAITNAKNSE